MTNYERIKAMSVDEMAILFHSIGKELNQKWFDKLKSAGIIFEKFDLADEIQIEIQKKFLESEFDAK